MMRKVVLTDTERDAGIAHCRENGFSDPASIAAYLDGQRQLKKDLLMLARIPQPTGWTDGKVTVYHFRNLFHSLSAKHGTRRAKEIASAVLHRRPHTLGAMMSKADFEVLTIEPEFYRAFYEEVTGFAPGLRT